MKAYQCDICGEYYTDMERNGFGLHENNEEGFYTKAYDLCPECRKKFQLVAKEFIGNQRKVKYA